MPRQLAHPEVLVTSLDDFIEKMKKPENHSSFWMQVIFAQNERKRLRDKDTRRRQRMREAAAAAEQAEQTA
jgi:hypothetical protein